MKTETNYRAHVILSIVALILGWLLRISYTEFVVVLLLIFIGLPIEMINTAIEEATDAIDSKWREDLKIAKDVAAGAMLVFSLGALVIAGVIYLPKIYLFIMPG